MNYLLDTNACIALINGKPIAVRNRFQRAIEVGEQVSVSLLAFEDDDAKSAGTIRATLEKAGRPIGAYDLLIAGQAVRNKVTLVTANSKEFARVKSLAWEDWAKV